MPVSAVRALVDDHSRRDELRAMQIDLVTLIQHTDSQGGTPGHLFDLWWASVEQLVTTIWSHSSAVKNVADHDDALQMLRHRTITAAKSWSPTGGRSPSSWVAFIVRNESRSANKTIHERQVRTGDPVDWESLEQAIPAVNEHYSDSTSHAYIERADERIADLSDSLGLSSVHIAGSPTLMWCALSADFARKVSNVAVQLSHSVRSAAEDLSPHSVRQQVVA